jgi:cytochrome bd-type quinol oxidase subunit 2
MFLYTSIEAIVAVVAGILIAVCTKKADDVTYSKLDKIGRVTNILLLLFYIGFSFFYLFLGAIANPRYDGFLGILGWIVSIIMASAALFCGVGLGLSVAFRKRGRSKLSFAVQFLGIAGIVLTVILFFLFYGNLLRPIN